MNIATLIVENEQDKIVLVKSKDFADQLVLPYLRITDSKTQTAIASYIATNLGLLVTSVDLLNTGEFQFNAEKGSFELYHVKVSGSEFILGEAFTKALFQDPHKALKLVFTEPFTLNILDYLKAKSN